VFAFHPCYAHPLPDGHRFPMLKYELIPEQLIYEGSITPDQLFEPGMPSLSSLLAVHDQSYLDKLFQLSLSKSEERKTGFPLSKELILREQRIMQGTVECALIALEKGFALNIAGGTHHAFRDRGEGFCLLNDLAIAAQYLLDRGLRKRILIVDLDVHQGNGTASIFQKENRVFTFSMHGEHNYPLQKEKSDLDIPLPDGCSDAQFLGLLNYHLPKVVDQFQPDFIFYQSGVDILETDKLGRMKVSLEGLKERDRIVVNIAQKNQIPLTGAMGGGYSEDIRIIVEAHCNLFRLITTLAL
jgi:acetoin utilization deacetylase AcuC-like enzyme